MPGKSFSVTNVKEKLKKRVLEFVKAQPGYDAKKHEKLDAFCEDKDTYMVIYGHNLWCGLKKPVILRISL